MPSASEISSLFSFIPRDSVTVTKKRLRISATSISSDIISLSSTILLLL